MCQSHTPDSERFKREVLAYKDEMSDLITPEQLIEIAIAAG